MRFQFIFCLISLFMAGFEIVSPHVQYFFEVVISKFPTQGFDLSCKCTPWQKRAQDFQILLPEFIEIFP